MAEMDAPTAPEFDDTSSDALVRTDTLVEPLTGLSILDLAAETPVEIYKHVLAGVRISLRKVMTAQHTANLEARILKGDHAETWRNKVKIRNGEIIWNDLGLTLVSRLIRLEFLSVFASTKSSLRIIGKRARPLDSRSILQMPRWYVALVREFSWWEHDLRKRDVTQSFLRGFPSLKRVVHHTSIDTRDTTDIFVKAAELEGILDVGINDRRTVQDVMKKDIQDALKVSLRLKIGQLRDISHCILRDERKVQHLPYSIVIGIGKFSVRLEADIDGTPRYNRKTGERVARQFDGTSLVRLPIETVLSVKVLIHVTDLTRS
jgi:hypothetical protein